MTLRAPCLACRHGRHDQHVDVPKPGTPGLIGSRHECPCRGECMESAADRALQGAAELEQFFREAEEKRSSAEQVKARSSVPCPYCEGEGCSECDGTGERHATHVSAGDGLTAVIHGSAPLSDEAADAIVAVMRAAFDQMERGE